MRNPLLDILVYRNYFTGVHLIMFMNLLSQRRSGDTWVHSPPARNPAHMPRSWTRVKRVEWSIVPHFSALLRGNDTSLIVRPRSSSTHSWNKFCAPGGRASPFSFINCISGASAKQQRRREAPRYEISNVEIDILRNKLLQENTSENVIERDVLHRNRNRSLYLLIFILRKGVKRLLKISE